MMALAARDPYYLAAFSRERLQFPAARARIDELCTRCHAPAARAEAEATGQGLGLELITRGTGTLGVFARDGVDCVGCHAISPEGLGNEATFSGRSSFAPGRVVFGLQPQPLVAGMYPMSKFTPVYGPHIARSALCATCHTVLTRALDDQGREVGPELPEQVPYLEWRNSIFADEGGTPGPEAMPCQGCHVPVVDEDGDVILTALSTRPVDAPARRPYGRHVFAGGNAYMLRLLAGQVGWLGAGVSPEELEESARASEAMVARAGRLRLRPRAGGVIVRVENHAGHKLPTAYPTRRAWVHVVARDVRGAVVFESGGHTRGRILQEQFEKIEPHRTVVTRADQVQIYEAVPVDAAGRRTHLLLGATRFAKDNRLLPRGWRADHPDAPRTRPIGTDGDESFTDGSDEIAYDLPPTARRVEVELLYQSLTPDTLAQYPGLPTPEAARFAVMTADRPPLPVRVATASLELRTR